MRFKAEIGAIALALLLFVRVVATIVGPLGRLGTVAWVGAYISALILIVSAIDRVGADRARSVRRHAQDSTEPVIDRIAS